MNSQDPAKDAREIWRALSKMVLDVDRKSDVSEALGISFGRARVLRRLLDGPLTQKELARRLATDPPNVTVMIDNLESRGLLERRPHPDDRRAKLVGLTRSGRKAARRAEQILDEPPLMLQELSGADLAELRRIFGVSGE
ncbi:MAG: MarR family transcriptional regulator [Solirubrobacterales bacterium]|nr:MarR family transcriptional regulator [Solirubrobacterales bacterium]MCB8915633.1 MarR family transcriptional regulator [Thermoleophilales bacterium]